MYPKTFFEQNPPRPESGQCFVLMPFADRFEEVYATVAETLEGPELNFRCVRADELFGGGHIIEDILKIWVSQNAAKFELMESRHVLGQPVETVRRGSYGIRCGEGVQFAELPWKLVLEETKADTAHFRVVPTK